MKNTYRLVTALTLTLTLIAANAVSTNPDIKDGAIKVLLNFKTSCNAESLSREVTEDNGLKFTVQCGDKTSYPEGLIVLCSERDVDTSCKIKTKPKEFKHLNLIYGPAGKNVHYSDQQKEGE